MYSTTQQKSQPLSRQQAPAPSAPITAMNQLGGKVPWSTGLCDCFSDVPNCCITCWCPCITFGHIAEIVDQGSTSCGASGTVYALTALLAGCAWMYSCSYRSRLRTQLMLEEAPCGDCCVHACCETCSLCQESRELKNRGYDLTLGWHGNMLRQQTGGVSTAPVVESGMGR